MIRKKRREGRRERKREEEAGGEERERGQNAGGCEKKQGAEGLKREGETKELGIGPGGEVGEEIRDLRPRVPSNKFTGRKGTEMFNQSQEGDSGPPMVSISVHIFLPCLRELLPLWHARNIFTWPAISSSLIASSHIYCWLCEQS